eukprot:7975825-Alexandrium_andersonii.AAC.1
MSASLVGSEMCIRDRHQGAVSPHSARCGRLKALPEEGWNAPRRRLNAVSYTHLTLPTICSV